ncbi:hypothetical protein IQ273_32895 [Nodosilinea sp. LEGE 07298]|uniref:hypothetical protein n=1 Tax=Nodosilinea sp. LEGE 07298 TaxID=2777970 RepID=UPI001882C3C9|nr:hypothetical protein [Nodosilinea sp. LEGE 07298]MBE9114161.1 hypothetical protein [Nodosilinea sp. LEGE 07298]
MINRSLIVAGLVAGTFAQCAILTPEVRSETEVEVAYCNTDGYAIKIYTLGGLDPESPRAGETFVRIYDRTFMGTVINRTPVSHRSTVQDGIAGTEYENLMGESQWQIFMASAPGQGFDPESPSANPSAGVHQCIMSRNGEVMAYGTGRASSTLGQ